MFRPVESNVSFPQLEAGILKLWDERGIYGRSLAQRAGAEKFVFFEGPPTANGLPHPGHCLTRAIKDLFPRYKTMRGFRCERKGGWDTHGLPVEVEVCKELGIHSKEEIEEFGVEPFIHRCMESVFRYTREWEELTRRLGFWVDLEQAYVTYHQSYVESVWWALKTLFDRGLLYKGHKIVWWWAQGGTALSAGEVGEGYREVADPSVYVRFPLLDEAGEESGEDLLIWTTTPWTLPSNQFAAVHPELEYATVRDDELGRKLILAADLVETVAGKVKRELVLESTCRGKELIGRRYLPPFDFYHKDLGQRQGELKSGGKQHVAWRITSAEFVTTESGTGAVHEAPAFGEVDFELLIKEQARFVDGRGPEMICAVAPDGKFTEVAGDYAGTWVKDADKPLCRELRRRGLMYHQEQYLHEYPFCPRAEDDPLIQYPRESWFIRTRRFREKMLANNALIGWLPEHIRDGRFGNFLEDNVDWALSRERYWGTPLPVWVCEQTGNMEAVGSYDELLAKPGVAGVDVWQAAQRDKPDLAEHLKVHKPYIDAVTYDSPFAPGARMRISGEVIDCWFDSGAMPFAQWGFPHQGNDQFENQFPADFISEAIDQTRGWFYSLLAISTLLFGDESSTPLRGVKNRRGATSHNVEFPHPFRNCIVLGLMLSEWWESPDGKDRFLTEEEARQAVGNKAARKVGKMSKRLRNYPEPARIFDTYGADALRWFFFANQAPWTSIIYSERAIKDTVPEFLLRLWHCYNFFVTYANIDGFNPAEGMSGEAGQLAAEVLARGDSFRPFAQRSELDRWVISELHRTTAAVVQSMDAYDNYTAAREINEFVDALSNWYVRRSRDRFWSSEKSQDKLDAYWTLYECLLTTSKLIAPFTPFLAEAMWQNLAVAAFDGGAAASVHLCDYPTGEAALVDESLSQRMRLMREIVSLGRSARSTAGLKVRQPLAEVEVALADAGHQPWLEDHAALIREELNVKQAGFTSHAEQYVTYSVLPDLPRLGPRLGKQLPALRKAIAAADAAELLQQMEASGQAEFNLPDGAVTLDREDLQVRLQAKDGWAAAQGPSSVVVLNTELNDDLIAEGKARDVVRLIQDRRKAMGLEFTDRIIVALVTDDESLRSAVGQFADYIKAETLAVQLGFAALKGIDGLAVVVAGSEAELFVAIAGKRK